MEKIRFTPGSSSLVCHHRNASHLPEYNKLYKIMTLYDVYTCSGNNEGYMICMRIK